MPPSTRVKNDMPPKLYQGPPFVPWDRPCVRFEEAEHFLAFGHFLALQHTGACLSDDPRDSREEPVVLGRGGGVPVARYAPAEQ